MQTYCTLSDTSRIVSTTATTMAKIALFGDSYLARLQRFSNDDLRVPVNANFFCVGGMRADSVFTDRRFREQFDRMLEFRPEAVFINLGANDINSNSTPAEIVRHISAIVDTLRENGVQTVYYQELGERGTFRGSISAQHFERQRRAVNKKLKKKFKQTFTKFRIPFPQYFDTDLVHYSNQGMRAYYHGVRRVLSRHRSRV